MVYEVPESKRSIDQDKFEFKVPGDRRKYKIPKVKYLPLDAIKKLEAAARGGEAAKDVTLDDIVNLFGSDAAVQKAIGTLDTSQLQALTIAWQQDSGVSVGESSASSSS